MVGLVAGPGRSPDEVRDVRQRNEGVSRLVAGRFLRQQSCIRIPKAVLIGLEKLGKVLVPDKISCPKADLEVPRLAPGIGLIDVPTANEIDVKQPADVAEACRQSKAR